MIDAGVMRAWLLSSKAVAEESRNSASTRPERDFWDGYQAAIRDGFEYVRFKEVLEKQKQVAASDGSYAVVKIEMPGFKQLATLAPEAAGKEDELLQVGLV